MRTDADKADVKRGTRTRTRKREERHKKAEIEETGKTERVKEKEINEIEGRQLPVGVFASPWSD